MTGTLRVLYFAWVRERVGVPEETLDLPGEVVTVADLITHLAGKGENYAYAFEARDTIRAALDKRHVPHATPLSGAREVAFFPPMTGG